MIHRMTGWARSAMPILIGEMTEVSHSANALMTTTNRPRVENSSRPVRATRTGRAKRLTSTRIAAQIRKPTIPTPWSSTIGLRVRAERERLGDLDEAEEEDDDPKEDRVDHDLDDEIGACWASHGDPGATFASRSLAVHCPAPGGASPDRRRHPHIGSPIRDLIHRDCDDRIRVWIGRDDPRAWRAAGTA